jgi:acyl-CoA thioester hydrolase
VIEDNECPGRLPGMVPCFWGSVNQWECDENDHLNVRYYAHKTHQAIQILLAQRGGWPERAPAAPVAALHVRFLRESRSATPLRIDCAPIRAADGSELVLAIMHHNVTGDPLAAFQVHLRGPIPVAGGATATLEIPEFAAPRGIDPGAMLAPPPSLEAALAIGFRVVGRGVIAADECNADGELLPHAYIGRISDGMPNLWAFLSAEADRSARGSGALGGAALEQRVRVHRPLGRGAVFSQLSGLRALGNKTQHMAHLLYDHASGEIAASIEAVGVAMDLGTRRAVPIAPERRGRLTPLLLRDPG